MNTFCSKTCEIRGSDACPIPPFARQALQLVGEVGMMGLAGVLSSGAYAQGETYTSPLLTNIQTRRRALKQAADDCADYQQELLAIESIPAGDQSAL